MFVRSCGAVPRVNENIEVGGQDYKVERVSWEEDYKFNHLLPIVYLIKLSK